MPGCPEQSIISPIEAFYENMIVCMQCAHLQSALPGLFLSGDGGGCDLWNDVIKLMWDGRW